MKKTEKEFLSNRNTQYHVFFKTKRFKIILVLVLMLVVVRISLPYIVLHFANKTLSEMPGYYGHLKDVDISLLRGAYLFDNFYLDKVDTLSGSRTPFLDIKIVKLSLDWEALFEGSIVASLFFENPTLVFTKEKAEPKDIAKDSASFQVMFKKFMPLKINRFEINQGTIQYLDATTIPKVDIKMDQTHVVAVNLTNSTDNTETLPSQISGQANMYDGKLSFQVRMDLLAKAPTFDMNTEVSNVRLTLLNDFFKAYGNMDVNSGTFGLYSEVASKNGTFVGYVKPLIYDLDVLGKEDKKDNILKKVWEGIAGSGGFILSNQKYDQVASKIPIEGDYGELETDTWTAIITLLRNAFISALMPSLDHEISLHTIGGKEVENNKGGFLKNAFVNEDENDVKGKKSQNKKDRPNKN